MATVREGDTRSGIFALERTHEDVAQQPLPASVPPDCTPDRRRVAAPDPLAAACPGSDRNCACPDFATFPEGRGGVSLLATGSFTGAYPEALVELTMCGPHSENWGGTVLVRQTPAGWLPTAYLPGFVPTRCAAHRGPDGLDRLACLETYGLNQGTYSTSATVVDLVARRYDTLIFGMCEDARDVQSVAWHSADAGDLAVEVVIEYGERRDNRGDSCETLGGKAVAGSLTYGLEPNGYVPDEPSKQILGSLPTAGGSPVQPSREPLGLRDVDPCVR